VKGISKNPQIKNAKIIFTIMLYVVLPIIMVSQCLAQSQDTTDITMQALELPNREYAATQMPAEVGKPVQWVMRIDVENLYDQTDSELSVMLPDDATNVTAYDSTEGRPLDVDVLYQEAVISDTLNFKQKKTYLLRYSTSAPEKRESALVRIGTRLSKNVIVSSEYHYEDILTYTQIPEIDKSSVDKVRLYWQLNGTKTDVTSREDFDVRYYDTDRDGKYDLMSWMTPHLSTQIFEVVILSQVDPGNYSDITVNLVYPADNAYITSNNRMNFNYSVQYNSSTTVYCNLTVDGVVKRANIPTTSNTEITTYFNISSGQHSWYVTCSGNDGAAKTSSTRGFTIDLDSPVVTMNVPDYYVSYTNGIYLNFTPTDTKYPVLLCSLSINDAVNRTGIVVNNNTQYTVLLTSMANGVYKWNVSCDDAAGNRGSSEQRIFYISAGTPSEYNISPNKASYSMGEAGYFIISAKAGSNLTIFVDTPLHDSFFRYYNGKTFPFVELINFTGNSGTYNIDGMFTNGGSMYVVKTSFTVQNSFEATIEMNDTAARPGDSMHFEANATGGIGAVTYEWDFDDGTEANGTEVDHTFSGTGEYTVTLTATDSKGNKATVDERINIFNLHNIQIILRDLLTQRVLPNITVEVDDERKHTDVYGSVNFSVYEGKRRIYVSNENFDWVKQVRNITEDEVITIDLTPLGTSNYTYDLVEVTEDTAMQENSTAQSAELLLAQVTAALETIESNDQATKDVMDALSIKLGLENAQKEIRQIIRDMGNAESTRNLSADERAARIGNITSRLDGLKQTATSIEVKDTTDYVDYAKSSDVAMLSAEYLRYKKINYSNREKENYIKKNTELQTGMTIKTRLAIAQLTLLSGDTKAISIVINKISKLPNETSSSAILEYVPKEVATSVDEINALNEFETVKSDPILKFSPSVTQYAYYVEKDVGMAELRTTKHVLLKEPTKEMAGLLGVTGFSIFPKIKIGNTKLFFEILAMIVLLLVYIAYHFEAVDRVKEYVNRRSEGYSPDAESYDPTKGPSFAMKVGDFIRKEENDLSKELSYIKSLMAKAHSHASQKSHTDAHETYKEIMYHYKSLSKEAKQAVHPETQQVYNTIMLSKINHLLEEAFTHIDNNNHEQAKSHYSEIKQIYSKLGKEHRTAVSDKCIKLHERLFELSLN
jgi:hypothetical protein